MSLFNEMKRVERENLQMAKELVENHMGLDKFEEEVYSQLNQSLYFEHDVRDLEDLEDDNKILRNTLNSYK